MQLQIPGFKSEHKKSQRQVCFEVNSESEIKFGEQIPEFKKRDNLKSFVGIAKTERLMKFKASFLINEDPRKSSFSYGKLMVIEKLSAILCLLIFFLSCTKTEIDIYYKSSSNIAAIYLMRCISVCVAALMLVLVLRHFALFQLEMAQNKVYVSKSGREWVFFSFAKHTDKVKNLMFELLLAAPHPMCFLSEVRVKLLQTYDQIQLNHSLNDLLSLLLVVKLYIVIRGLLNISIYSSPRSSRLCYQNGFENSHLYSIKCILNDMPIRIIALNFGMFLIIGGYGLKLSEGVLSLYNAEYTTGFESYTNCFWCIFITMATVGYGDLLPKTMPGRIIIIFIAISGVLLSTLLIVSLNLYLNMSPPETKSHLIVSRLQQQEELMQQASAAIAYTIKVKQLMQKENREDHRLQFQFENLKKKLESAGNRSRQIKSMVDNDNIIEEMSRLFFILRDNLKDLYIGQLKLKEEVAKIEEIQSVKRSFIKEVTQLLSRTQNSQQAGSRHSSDKKSYRSRVGDA